jgi:hypothetical protein
MADSLTERIRRVVNAGREARTAYYASIALDDEQELGASAPEAALADLERRLGRPLPPSYRAFLSLYNGWRMFSGAVDLLCVEDMLGGPRAEQIRTWRAREASEWQRVAREDPSSRGFAARTAAVAARALVIGVSDITRTRILLDPETISMDGEWASVTYDGGLESEYRSFLERLEASNAYFRQYVENPEAFQ